VAVTKLTAVVTKIPLVVIPMIPAVTGIPPVITRTAAGTNAEAAVAANKKPRRTNPARLEESFTDYFSPSSSFSFGSMAFAQMR
jgi:hypothetical protein